MSRIFDALQRSGVEQSGVEYPDLISVVTGVFDVPRETAAPEASASVQSAVAVLDEPELELPVAEVTAAKPVSQELAEFPALSVSVKPTSRLVFFTEPDSLAAEKFRFLGVRLRQLQQSRSIKKVLVTSSIPEEGKSLISANLAGVL